MKLKCCKVIFFYFYFFFVLEKWLYYPGRKSCHFAAHSGTVGNCVQNKKEEF